MGKEEKTKPLAEQVEVIIEPSVDPQVLQDQLDPNVLDYINQFLYDFNQIGPLEDIDLMTPESAQNAVEMLTARHKELQEKLKTAQALTKLAKS